MIRSLILLSGLIILSALLLGCGSGVQIGTLGIDTDPVAVRLHPGELLKFKMSVLKSGLAKFIDGEVKIEHALVQKSTGKILETKTETIHMQGAANLERGVSLSPKMVPGEYKLRTTAKRNNLAATSSFDFKVIDSMEEQKMQALQLMGDEIEIELGSEGISLEKEKIIEVAIKNYKAEPEKVVIKPGTKIRWTNKDTISHTVTGAGFDSGPIDPNKTFVYVFNETGLRYIYKSTIHNRVLGEVAVRGE